MAELEVPKSMAQYMRGEARRAALQRRGAIVGAAVGPPRLNQPKQVDTAIGCVSRCEGDAFAARALQTDAPCLARQYSKICEHCLLGVETVDQHQACRVTMRALLPVSPGDRLDEEFLMPRGLTKYGFCRPTCAV